MSKIIITIVGKDRVGIVAKTCNYLAENGMNILDITQTILQEYFNMMMIVDISKSTRSWMCVPSPWASAFWTVWTVIWQS